jgi:hypothetical protein
MNNDIDSQIIACAQIIRAAVNNETEVTVSRRVVISAIHPATKLYYDIFFGDILNRAKWKWGVAQADTLAEAQDKALALIAEQGDERKRELVKLQESAAKLGLQLVEAAQ